jgi:hypothetical protein
MHKQIVVEDSNPSDIVEGIENETESQIVNSDPSAEKVRVDAELIHETKMIETNLQEAPISTNAGSSTALLDLEESEHLHTRWSEIQGKFVDEPRSAVQQADALVTEVIEKITQMFVNEHSLLESQWNQGDDEVSTEDLRQALQHYRAFFNRLVV